MSRTLHVDLTPSRRSKRLLQNGYYLQPPGEHIHPPEFSSEDDDDSASVHSNNSSIYSERAVHYTESPTSAVFAHKRRKRKGIESPRLGSLLVQTKSHSPILKKKSHLAESSSTSRSTPNLLNVIKSTNQKKLSVATENETHARKETKTTIRSIKQTSHRYARGESSSVTQSSYTNRQSATQNVTSNNAINRIVTHESVLTRNRSQYNAIGSGDQREMQNNLQRGSMHSQVYSAPREFLGDAEEQSKSGETIRHRKAYSQYSSAESEAEDKGENVRHSDEYSHSRSTINLGKESNIFVMFLAWISTFIEYICRTIYQTTLTIFVFDVWWLSRRTSPLFVKIARFLLLFLLLMLLLTSTYLLITRMFGDYTEMVLLPIQPIAGFFQLLSQKANMINLFSEKSVEVTHEKTQETPYPHPKTDIEMNEAMMKLQLHFADKLVKVKDEVTAIRREQIDFNKKQLEDLKNVLSALENKLKGEITKQLRESNTQTAEKLLALRNEIAAIRINHTSTGEGMKADIEQLRGLLSDKSQMSIKINEFNNRLAAFDARLNSLNELMMKSVRDFDVYVGNTTYMKEIAKLQFIENFLKLIKSGEGSTEDKNNLHFLFIAWLKKQGFAQIDEVDRNMKSLAANYNLTMAVLEKKFAVHLERIRHDAKRHSSTITLEKIVERPASEQDTDKLSTEAQVREWIQNELAIYSADRIGLADHALESAGGYIVSTRCSESYNRKTSLVSLFGIPIYYNINTPRSVIQPGALPGECWSFKGSEGYIVVALSGSVRPTSFTLEHIPRELSPYGRIDSAPKDFTVLGLADVYDYTGTELGKYRYEQDGPVIQQFAVVPESSNYYTHIELRVTSNWGHPEYTCLYRFRVHGTRRSSEPPLI